MRPEFRARRTTQGHARRWLRIIVIVIVQRIRGGFEIALPTAVVDVPVEAPTLAIAVGGS
jgi:hypothetical protein